MGINITHYTLPCKTQCVINITHYTLPCKTQCVFFGGVGLGVVLGYLGTCFYLTGIQTTDNYKLHTENYRLQTANYKLQTTDYRLQTTNYKLQTTD